MTIPVSDWLDIPTVAAELAVPEADIVDAIQTGQLPALRIGPHLRINRQVLLDLAATPARTGVAVAQQTPPGQAPTIGRHLPVPRGLTWQKDPAPDEPFDYDWPHRAGGQNTESYDNVWNGKIALHGERFAVRIGEAARHEPGRLAVFFGGTPICEFVETLDRQRWASLVKPDGKKTLPPGAPPPPLYRAVELQLYREATGLTGSGVPKSLAVVLDRYDLRSVVHHAAARWLGRNGLPVEADTSVV